MRCVSAKRLIMDWRLDLITTRTRALVDREKKIAIPISIIFPIV